MAKHQMKSLELTRDEAMELFPWLFTNGKLDKGSKIPKFPDSTEIHMDNVILKKLGLTAKDFKLKDEFQLNAKVVVEKVSHEESLGEEPQMHVHLQMTHMEILDSELPLEDQIFKAV